jgi:uncharacterized protein (TIGR02246 family)
VEPQEQPDPQNPSQPAADEGLERNRAVEEFFQRLMEKQDLHRPRPSAEAMAAALQAIQRLGLRSGDLTEEFAFEAEPASPEGQTSDCPHCGHHNVEDSKFCAMCGAPQGTLGPIPSARPGGASSAEAQHHYHHHYHHHFMAGQDADSLSALGQRVPPAAWLPPGAGKDLKLRPAGPSSSRAEAAIRQLTQEWALACNNKQVDDLLEFYAADAMVMRPNVSAVRGMAAIREFFVAALEAGLGDVEMEPLRVEVLGEVAYQAGKCKMLVPVAMGKRREERGKYVMVFARQKGGEWKAVVDCWSSDLGLNVAAESLTPHSPAPMPAKPRRI